MKNKDVKNKLVPESKVLSLVSSKVDFYQVRLGSRTWEQWNTLRKSHTLDHIAVYSIATL